MTSYTEYLINGIFKILYAYIVDMYHVQVREKQLFTAQRSYASAVLGVVILSVSPSVCHTHAL